jgi:hypothetical protein
MPSQRTGLLIIRAWTEVGSEEPLRAQVRVTQDIATGMESTRTLVQPDTVVELVVAWLEDFLSTATPDE